nr:MAG TPA: hypothetical protein [Caudoviricetes sp.]
MPILPISARKYPYSFQGFSSINQTLRMIPNSQALTSFSKREFSPGFLSPLPG